MRTRIVLRVYIFIISIICNIRKTRRDPEYVKKKKKKKKFQLFIFR